MSAAAGRALFLLLASLLPLSLSFSASHPTCRRRSDGRRQICLHFRCRRRRRAADSPHNALESFHRHTQSKMMPDDIVFFTLFISNAIYC